MHISVLVVSANNTNTLLYINMYVIWLCDNIFLSGQAAEPCVYSLLLIALTCRCIHVYMITCGSLVPLKFLRSLTLVIIHCGPLVNSVPTYVL